MKNECFWKIAAVLNEEPNLVVIALEFFTLRPFVGLELKPKFYRLPLAILLEPA
jgi:hypothetical protein